MPEAFAAPAIQLRPARREDAPHLARLLNMAGHGLPLWFWSRAAGEGVEPMAFGAARAAQDEGDFTWRNSTLAEIDGAVAGGLITYRIASAPVPLDDLPAVFRPLQALENRVRGTQYVLVLATYPDFRRRGVGSALLVEAERRARGIEGGAADGLSLIVADGNTEALRLYRARGYAETAAEPVVSGDGWACDSENWLLLVKPLAPPM